MCGVLCNVNLRDVLSYVGGRRFCYIHYVAQVCIRVHDNICTTVKQYTNICTTVQQYNYMCSIVRPIHTCALAEAVSGIVELPVLTVAQHHLTRAHTTYIDTHTWL